MRAAGNLAVLERGHQEALENFLREFDAQPDELHGYFTPRDASIDQAIEFLRTATDESRLPPGRVPASTWFWENRSTLQGVVNLRHRLTPELRAIAQEGREAPPKLPRAEARAMSLDKLPYNWISIGGRMKPGPEYNALYEMAKERTDPETGTPPPLEEP